MIFIREQFLASGAKCKYLKPRVEQFKHYISCILLQAMQPRQLRAAIAGAATGNKQAAAMAITTTQITWLQTQLSPSSCPSPGCVFDCSCCIVGRGDVGVDIGVKRNSHGHGLPEDCACLPLWWQWLLRRMPHIRHKEYAQNSTPSLLPFYLFLMALPLCQSRSWALSFYCRYSTASHPYTVASPSSPSPCS